MMRHAIGGGDVVAAVADRPVQLAVDAADQPVHVVAAEGDANAEPRQQRVDLIGPAVAVAVAQLVQVRNAGEVHVRRAVLVLDRQHAGGGAVDQVAEVREHRRLLIDAVGVAFGQVTQPVRADLVGRGVVVDVALQHGGPVGDGLVGQVVLQPVHMPAVVLDAEVLPVRLADVQVHAVVEREGDRVGHERLGRDDRHVDALGVAEPVDRQLRLARCRHHAEVGIGQREVGQRIIGPHHAVAGCGEQSGQQRRQDEKRLGQAAGRHEQIRANNRQAADDNTHQQRAVINGRSL